PGRAGLGRAVVQMALEQHPRELTVQEGDAVTFQCSMKRGDMNSYYMYWYHQGPKGSLRFICHEDDFYGEDFQDRFKVSLHSSKDTSTLQILAAKQGDEAMYYCGVLST
uniref:Ig-like domain-containing protein n=1 Tax=Cyanistes caeruleus TaxID=156563 RepID=A0A8C0U518_CYACU